MESNRNDRPQEAAFRPIVGIDLGTTNSAVAYLRDGKPQLIASPKNERIIPSVVLIDPNGKVIVGEDARAALVAMPDRTIAAVKRRMGSTEPVPIAGQALLPEQLSALILMELKTYVDHLYGEGEKEAVITVPAYFTDAQRKATKEAGELAGFVVERIINEPTAAALAFGLEHLDEDRVFLVYDLGGGTFDVSVVEMMSGLLEVKASTGNNRLGGEDFDWMLVDVFAERILAEHGVDPREDIRAKALLKEEAENVKKKLSAETDVPVMLPLVTVKNNQPIGLATNVSRAQFEELIRERIDETIESVRHVLQEADLRPQDIDEVLLVGGSTYMPCVTAKLAEVFGKRPRTDINPDEAVALGAAVQAGLKSGSLSASGLVATDVAPYSMGIAVLKEGRTGMGRPGGFAPIIKRNTTIPVTKTEKFYTSTPGQTAVSIEVFQGEHDWVKHNHLLGQFMLEGIPQNWEKQEQIEVTFRYNLNGILETTATCVSTQKEMSVVMRDALNRESRQTFQESMERLGQLWAGIEPGEEPDEDEDSDWSQLDSEIDLLLDETDDGPEEPAEGEAVDRGQLIEEANRLIVRARELVAIAPNEESREKAEQVVRLLERTVEAAEEEDEEGLQSVLDEAADRLIELEL